MSVDTFVATVTIALFLNEYSDTAPWLADKLIRRAARLYYADDPDRALVRAEEWAALIADRPGKVLKLATAIGHLGIALAAVTRRMHPARLALRAGYVLRMFLTSRSAVADFLVLRSYLSERLGPKAGSLAADAAVIGGFVGVFGPLLAVMQRTLPQSAFHPGPIWIRLLCGAGIFLLVRTVLWLPIKATTWLAVVRPLREGRRDRQLELARARRDCKRELWLKRRHATTPPAE